MARVNSRSAPRMIKTNSFWYRLKTLASDFLLTTLARYSTPFLRPRNTAPVWDFVSAKPLLRPTVAGFGPWTTILAEQFSISRCRPPRKTGAWARGATDLLRKFSFANLSFLSAEEPPAKSGGNSDERLARGQDFSDFHRRDSLLDPFPDYSR